MYTEKGAANIFSFMEQEKETKNYFTYFCYVCFKKKINFLVLVTIESSHPYNNQELHIVALL